MMAEDFPYSMTIRIPFPSAHLARIAMRALEVDKELSPLVKRSFVLTGDASSAVNGTDAVNASGNDTGNDGGNDTGNDGGQDVLETTYEATTNRMLRVSVNGFMESIRVVLGVMGELDKDILQSRAGEAVQIEGIERGEK